MIMKKWRRIGGDKYKRPDMPKMNINVPLVVSINNIYARRVKCVISWPTNVELSSGRNQPS